eukprot:gene458-238_t
MRNATSMENRALKLFVHRKMMQWKAWVVLRRHSRVVLAGFNQMMKTARSLRLAAHERLLAHYILRWQRWCAAKVRARQVMLRHGHAADTLNHTARDRILFHYKQRWRQWCGMKVRARLVMLRHGHAADTLNHTARDRILFHYKQRWRRWCAARVRARQVMLQHTHAIDTLDHSARDRLLYQYNKKWLKWRDARRRSRQIMWQHINTGEVLSQRAKERISSQYFAHLRNYVLRRRQLRNMRHAQYFYRIRNLETLATRSAERNAAYHYALWHRWCNLRRITRGRLQH